MIGRFTTPTITNIDIKRSAFSRFENEPCNVRMPRYMINRMRVEVILASHCHQVPQVGIPQIDPENNAIKVIIAPIGAADLIKYAASFTRHTICINAQIDIK